MGYKTFEDMKHNIPEGATHYHNESDDHLFCWFKVDGGKWFVHCPDEGERWHKSDHEHHRVGIVQFLQTDSPEDREALDMIDTTSKQVESLANNSESPNSSEWENGDECMWNGIECTFIGMSISHPSIAIVEYLKGLVSINDRVYVDELSKPESPEQKSERERLEIVKKACLTVRHDYGLMTESDRNFLEKCGMEWLKAFEKVGCIKEQK